MPKKRAVKVLLAGTLFGLFFIAGCSEKPPELVTYRQCMKHIEELIPAFGCAVERYDEALGILQTRGDMTDTVARIWELRQVSLERAKALEEVLGDLKALSPKGLEKGFNPSFADRYNFFHVLPRVCAEATRELWRIQEIFFLSPQKKLEA